MRTYHPIVNVSPGASVPGNISFVKSRSPLGWTASLYLSGTIAEENWTAETFQRELDWYENGNEVDDITLIINSRGGDLYQASAMYDALSKCKKKVTARIYGVCGSAATLIACAAKEIYMAPNATWFIHNPSGAVEGNADDMAAYVENMKRFEDMLVGIYAGRTGLADEVLRAAMKANTTYNAEEAIAAGWADGLIEAEDPTVSPVAAVAAVAAVAPPAVAACWKGEPGDPAEPDDPGELPAPTPAPVPAAETVTVEKSSLKNFCDGLLSLFGLGGTESASADVSTASPDESPRPPSSDESQESEEVETEEDWQARYDHLHNEMKLMKAELEGKNAMITARTASLAASEKSFEDRVQVAATAQLAALGHPASDLPRSSTDTEPSGKAMDPARMSEREKFQAFSEAAPGDKGRVFRELFGSSFRHFKS